MCKTRLSPLKRSFLLHWQERDWGTGDTGMGQRLRQSTEGKFYWCVCVFHSGFWYIFSFSWIHTEVVDRRRLNMPSQELGFWTRENSFRAVLCWKAHKPGTPVVCAGAVGHQGGRMAAPPRPSVCYNITEMAQNLWTSITLGTKISPAEGEEGIHV